MMLLDTDVLIDIALDRRPHSDPAVALLDRIESTGETVFIAWHSVSNFYYLVSPSLGRRSARDFIVELTRFVQVAPADTEAIRYAASLPMKDFEDAMQVAAARACGPPPGKEGFQPSTRARRPRSQRTVRRLRSGRS